MISIFFIFSTVNKNDFESGETKSNVFKSSVTWLVRSYAKYWFYLTPI